MNSKRASNFAPSEENLLLELVCKYSHIVECKKTDTVSNKTKEATWCKVEKEFNANSNIGFRSAKVLKNKFENIKKRSRKNILMGKCTLSVQEEVLRR